MTPAAEETANDTILQYSVYIRCLVPPQLCRVIFLFSLCLPILLQLFCCCVTAKRHLQVAPHHSSLQHDDPYLPTDISYSDGDSCIIIGSR